MTNLYLGGEDLPDDYTDENGAQYNIEDKEDKRMYEKHKDNNFHFTHDHNGSYWHKLKEFLYLNKAPRKHRLKLYNKAF